MAKTQFFQTTTQSTEKFHLCYIYFILDSLEIHLTLVFLTVLVSYQVEQLTAICTLTLLLLALELAVP